MSARERLDEMKKFMKIIEGELFSPINFRYVYKDGNRNNINIGVVYNDKIALPKVRLWGDNKMQYHANSIMNNRKGNQEATDLLNNAVYSVLVDDDFEVRPNVTSAQVLNAIRPLTFTQDIRDVTDKTNETVLDEGDVVAFADPKFKKAAKLFMKIAAVMDKETDQDIADEEWGDDEDDMNGMHREDANNYRKVAKLLLSGKGKKAAERYDSMDTSPRERIHDILSQDELRYVANVFGKLDSRWLYAESINEGDAENLIEVLPDQIDEVGDVMFDDYGAQPPSGDPIQLEAGYDDPDLDGVWADKKGRYVITQNEVDRWSIQPTDKKGQATRPPLEVTRDAVLNLIKRCKRVSKSMFSLESVVEGYPMLKGTDIKVGSLWQGSSGSQVRVTAVENDWVYYDQLVAGAKPHRKLSFAFQCRYSPVVSEDMSLADIVESLLQEFPGQPKDYYDPEDEPAKQEMSADNDWDNEIADEIEDEELGLRFD